MKEFSESLVRITVYISLIRSIKHAEPLPSQSRTPPLKANKGGPKSKLAVKYYYRPSRCFESLKSHIWRPPSSSGSRGAASARWRSRFRCFACPQFSKQREEEYPKAVNWDEKRKFRDTNRLHELTSLNRPSLTKLGIPHGSDPARFMASGLYF